MGTIPIAEPKEERGDIGPREHRGVRGPEGPIGATEDTPQEPINNKGDCWI